MTSLPTLLTQAARSWWIRLLISVAILGYLASRIDMAAAVGAVLSLDPWYLTAVLGLVTADRVVMIVRWVLLLRANRVNIEASQAARIFLISSFVGSFLPAGIGGDAARAYGLSRITNAGDRALASVLVDRLLGILSLVLMGALGLIVWARFPDPDWRAGLAVGFVLLVCLGAFWADRLVTALPPSSRGSGVGRYVYEVGLAISTYRGHRGVLVQVMGWSVVVQLLRILQAYLLGLGLGIAVPFRYYLLFMPVGLLVLMLPVSVSGFGLPQGVIVWLLRPMGVADESSLALSTLIVLTGLAGNLPGLVLWLRKKGDSPL